MARGVAESKKKMKKKIMAVEKIEKLIQKDEMTLYAFKYD